MKSKVLIILFVLLNFTFCKQDEVSNIDTFNIDGFTNSSDFIVSNLKWDKSVVSFGFTSDFPDKYKEAVRNAFQTWDKVISINFSETQNPDINIIMGDLVHGGCPVNFLTTTLAHGCMNDPEKWGNFAGDLHFNKNQKWSTSNSISKDEIDVETIALHEIGHILGLEHSFNNNSVLFAYYTKGSIKRTLTTDDIDGIRELYSAITVPDVVTYDISNITQTSAKIYGNVVSENGSTIINRGVCWSLNINPTVNNEKKEENSGVGNFSINLTNLISNTTYFVRAYASNSAGVGYGASMSFKTNPTLNQIQISTNPISSITQNSAQTGGNITSDGGTTITNRGVCWSINQNPTISDSHTNDGSGSGTFNSSIMSLNSSTTYFIRSYATNNEGTIYGNQLSFTTSSSSNTAADLDFSHYQIIYKSKTNIESNFGNNLCIGFWLLVYIKNKSSIPSVNTSVTFESVNPTASYWGDWITLPFENGILQMGNINGNAENIPINGGWFQSSSKNIYSYYSLFFSIKENTLNGTSIPFNLILQDANGNKCNKTWYFIVEK